MKLTTSRFLLASLVVLAPTASALDPSSKLSSPIHRSGLNGGGSSFTILSVSNTNTQPSTPSDFGGTTNIQYNYVNTIPNAADPFLPHDCYVVDRVEQLTPGDTLAVLTNCHNAANASGWVYIEAQDPEKFKEAWDFPYLIGHVLVVNSAGGTYSINMIPDSQTESSTLALEFLAVAGSSLNIAHFQDPTEDEFYIPKTVTLAFDIFNDNEFQLSSTRVFRCWFDQPLSVVSPVFGEDFLRNNTPNDPQELDINCDNLGDFETGWAKVDAIIANSQTGTEYNPYIIGAITSGPASMVDGGRVLWNCAK